MNAALDWWPSPAKLNLCLHITGRRADGYHELQSQFQLLSVGDALAFEVLDSQDIELANPLDGVKNTDNLIYRAAHSLKQATQCTRGVRIHVKKRLPMGGGIGGGSSNAATALVALNHLWGTGLSVSALAKIGLTLGADVPIFVHGKTAFAQGVGEVIHDNPQPELWYLVANPGVHVSTQRVFKDPNLPRKTPIIKQSEYHFDTTCNDCQDLVMKREPKVANLLHWLLEYAPSRMTGTGACCFAVFEREDEANQALNAMPDHFTGFVAQGVNTSPLLDKLHRAQSDTRQ